MSELLFSCEKWVWLGGIAILLFCLFLGCSFFKNRPKTPASFAAYYASDSMVFSRLDTFDLSITDPDHRSQLSSNISSVRLAYISLGEANESRSWWGNYKGKSWVIEENPAWKGSFRLDIRSLEWQNFLLDTLIPDILSKGYDGLFMDTMDTPLFFENLDSFRFEGSRKALVDFIEKIRKRFPKIRLASNNALSALPDFVNQVDYLVIEGLNSRWSADTLSYAKTSTGERQKTLAKLSKRKGKPVLVIDYMEEDQQDLVDFSEAECKKLGFVCFRTVRALDVVRGIE